MLQTVSQRFQGSCMMIMRLVDDEVTFLGSGFLVHPDGYLITTARTVAENTNLVVVPPRADDSFIPITREKVAPVPVELVSSDLQRDVALLQMKPDIEINMPEGILGESDQDPRGSTMMSLGVPFGYYRMHNVIASQSILSGRIQTKSGTNLIVFDRRIQYGDIGGPLISVESGKIIGVVAGVFDPSELKDRDYPDGLNPINSDLSYAISIEYAVSLLDQRLQAEKEVE